MPIFNVPQSQISEPQKEVLNLLCRGCKKILEIGSWVGESTAILASEAKRNGGTVYVIDKWEGNVGTNLKEFSQHQDVYGIFESNMKELGLFDCIKVIRKDSKEAHISLDDKFFDMVYIDADHRYSGVSQDIKNYLQKVKIGGLIAGHDCEDIEYDEQFIEDDFVGGKHHGVIKAVTENLEKFKVFHSIWYANV